MFKNIMPNLMVENVTETVEFYTQKLSFSLVNSVPNQEGNMNFAIVKKDNCTLSFQLKSSLVEEYPSLSTDLIKPSLTLFITVDDVESLYEQLKETADLACELHNTFYGTKEFAVYDNNKNILTLAS